MDIIDVILANAKVVPRIETLESEMASITNPMLVKGTVDTVEDLEDIQNPEPGWVYLVGLEADPNKKEYVYTTEGTWDFLGYQMPIDTELSAISANAVQNSTITIAINGKASLTIIATAFDAATTYSKGKIVVKDGALYIYTANAASSGEWDASKWSAVTVGALLEAKVNASDLATVATSGAYGDLSGTPNLATVATSGAYSDLSGTPTLATVATSGSYADLTNTPTIDATPTSSSTNAVQSGGVYTALAGKQDEITAQNKLAQNLIVGFGTNYIELANGIRLYISDTTPTGTIPEGSLGIGF